MNWKNLGGVGAVLIMLIMAVMLSGCGISDSELNTAVTKAKLDAKAEAKTANDLVVQDLNSKLATKNTELTTANTKLTTAETKITELKKVEVVVEAVVEEPVEVIVELTEGYVIDEVEIGEEVEKVLTDKHLKLFDGEVKFDSVDYEVEEAFVLADLYFLSNREDYGANVYLTMQEESLLYKVVLENSFNTSAINSEETLVLNFKGSEVEIVGWTKDEVTFLKGEEYSLTEGTTVNVEGLVVKLVMVAENYVSVEVGTDREKVYVEGKAKTVGGLEVQLKEVLYQGYAGGVAEATLLIGSEVETVAEDGEEYEEDSMWSWVVGENYFGLVLTEELMDIDEDEDYKALATEEKVCLPGEYICVLSRGLDAEDVREYSLKVDTRKGDEYLKVTGDFTVGMKDYTKFYVNETGFYDRDLELVEKDCVELDGTEFSMSLVNGSLWVDNVEIELDLSYLGVSGSDVSDEDEDYLTDYGMVLSVPEDAVEDQDLKLSVPEEQRTATLVVLN